eukprot:scaffold281456_cov21-Tisochrysis_lutea.AAC.2
MGTTRDFGSGQQYPHSYACASYVCDRSCARVAMLVHTHALLMDAIIVRMHARKCMAVTQQDPFTGWPSWGQRPLGRSSVMFRA